MKYLKTDNVLGAEDAADAVKPSAQLEAHLAENTNRLDSLGEGAAAERAALLVDNGYVLVDLDRREEAWKAGRDALDLALPVDAWEVAVQACDVIYQSEQKDAIEALAHGVWLAVTYPVDPELSVAMLQHLIDETPPKADGAAVAAAVSRYIVDLRAEGKQREDLLFFTAQSLGDVARGHSQVDEQEVFDFWVERLELNDPSKFLPRLAQVLDVLVTGEWWFDRDELRSRLPD